MAGSCAITREIPTVSWTPDASMLDVSEAYCGKWVLHPAVVFLQEGAPPPSELFVP